MMAGRKTLFIMTAEPTHEPAQHALIGQSVGKYKISRLIGTGGMGVVFEAIHETLNQRVAIKVMHRKLMTDQAAEQRFMNEARTTSLVHHVGLVKVHDFGKLSDGSAYMMMEYLEGESLRDRLKRKERLPLLDSLRITRQIAVALAAAHDKGVIHRDLKPENVLMVEDTETPSGERAKVLDFGIAKVLEPEGGEVLKTTTGAILGTPTYMSPEQCRGIGQTSDRSDVYSLGCMLYQMLGGRPPFLGTGAGDLIAMHIMEAPKPLRELAPDVPIEVEALVHLMLEKKPEARPSMRQVLSNLEQLGQHVTASGTGTVVVIAPPETKSSPEKSAQGVSPSPARRSPIVWAAAALGLCGILASAGYLLRGGQDRPKPPPVAVVVQSPPQAVTPKKIKLSVQTQPSGAQVLDGAGLAVLGTTPFGVERVVGAGRLEVMLKLPGHIDQKVVFDGTVDDSRQITLSAAPVVVPPAPLPSVPSAKPPLATDVKKPGVLKWKNRLRPPGPANNPSNEDLHVPVVR
jgi:serine/threonine protein kinase